MLAVAVISAVYATNKYQTHLCGPPPLARMHVMVHLYALGIIRVVFLWREVEVWREGWIPKEGSDAFNDVSVENLT